MVVGDGSNGAWRGDRGPLYFYGFLRFVSLQHKRLGSPENMKVCVFCHCTMFSIANDKMLKKT